MKLLSEVKEIKVISIPRDIDLHDERQQINEINQMIEADWILLRIVPNQKTITYSLGRV